MQFIYNVNSFKYDLKGKTPIYSNNQAVLSCCFVVSHEVTILVLYKEIFHKEQGIKINLNS